MIFIALPLVIVKIDLKMQQLGEFFSSMILKKSFMWFEHEYDEYDDHDHDQAAGDLLSRLKTENPDKELFLLATACEVDLDLDLFTR